MNEPIRILGIAGSLRESSYNRGALRAAKDLAPEGSVVDIFELDGMPHFLRADDVAATYASLTRYELRDLDWYGTYAALQYAIVFLRIGARSVHFGEAELPATIDDLIMNAEPLERMLAGTYWS